MEHTDEKNRTTGRETLFLLMSAVFIAWVLIVLAQLVIDLVGGWLK